MLKKIQALLFSVLILFFAAPTVSSSCISDISAESAVLMEAEAGTVIYEKNSQKRLPMASTTKIMTAIIIIESLSLSHEFTVSDAAVGTEGTSAYLKKGDTLTVKDALYALLLQSANDVATALAIEAGKTTEGFVKLMNHKAEELGLSDTSFKNPSGLPAEGHYTSAKDLALLSAFCMENPVFRDIVSTKSYAVCISGEERTFTNHNRLLTLYEGAVGIKTGYTRESGRCLVGACEKDNVRLISVTLNAPDDWNDHKALFDLGFQSLRSYTLCEPDDFKIALPVAGKNTFIHASPVDKKRVTVKASANLTARILSTAPLIFPPVYENDTVGYVLFYADEKLIHVAALKACHTVK